MEKIRILCCALLVFFGTFFSSDLFAQKVKVNTSMTSPSSLESYPEIKKIFSKPPKLLLHYSIFRKNSEGGENKQLTIAIPEPDSIIVGKVYSLPGPVFFLFYDSSALDMRADMNKAGPDKITGTIKVIKFDKGGSMKVEFDMKGKTIDNYTVSLKDKKVFKPVIIQ